MTTLGIIDAHAHLAESPDPSRVIGELKSLGFVASIQGGVGPEDWHRQLRLAKDFPEFVKPVLGLHPWWVLGHSREECLEALVELERLLDAHPEVRGLGELGFDFFRDKSRDASGVQQEVFERQLEIALQRDLPLVIHSVHAHELTQGRLRQTAQRPMRGIVHAFSGSFEVAQGYTRLGLKLSVGPGLSEPGRFKQLKAAFPRLSPGDWVLESDGQGAELFQAARAAAGLTAREVAEILETSAKTLRALFF